MSATGEQQQQSAFRQLRHRMFGTAPPPEPGEPPTVPVGAEDGEEAAARMMLQQEQRIGTSGGGGGARSKLKDLFEFAGEDRKRHEEAERGRISASSSFSTNAVAQQASFEDDHLGGSARHPVDTYHVEPPASASADLHKMDELAILLHDNIERGKHRRRIHEYADTFWGKEAVDWLTGYGITKDAGDARNVLRHLMERRLMLRADHTHPLFNNTVERFLPKFAQKRKMAYWNSYASAARGFNDDHLYRFPPEAFARFELVVTVMRAQGLRYCARPHLGSFALSSKFRDERIDPYVRVEFGGKLHGKTDLWSDARNNNEPVWDMTFVFPIEVTNNSSRIPDLWVRVLDFHEVLDDAELGYVLIPGAVIADECTLGRVWNSLHALKKASQLGVNDRTYGEIELSLEIKAFKAKALEWTVFPEARVGSLEAAKLPKDDETGNERITLDATNLLKLGEEIVGSLNPNAGPNRSASRDGEDSAGDDAENDSEGGDGSGGSGEGGGSMGGGGAGGKKFRKQYKLCIMYCKPNVQSIPDMRTGSSVWAEYVLSNPPYRHSSGAQGLVWPVKNLGEAKIKGITEAELYAEDAVLNIKVYQLKGGMTVKIGEGQVPLKNFMPDLNAKVDVTGDEFEWKTLARHERVTLRRTTAFRRNRKRIVGDIVVKGVIEPDLGGDEDEDNDDDDINTGGLGGNLSTPATGGKGEKMVMEEELANVAAMLSDNGFVAPPSLKLAVCTEKVFCNLETLFWLVLSKNSSVFDTFLKKRKCFDPTVEDWRWGGRGRSVRVDTGQVVSDDEDNNDDDGGGVRTSSQATSATTTVNAATASSSAKADDDEDEAEADSPPSPATSQRVQNVPSKEQMGSDAGAGGSAPSERDASSLGGAPATTTVAAAAAAAEQKGKEKESDPPSSRPTSVASLVRSDSVRNAAKRLAPALRDVSSTISNADQPQSTKNVSTLSDGALEERSDGSLLATHAQDESLGNMLDDCPTRKVTYKRPASSVVSELTITETWRLKGFSPDKGFTVEIEGVTNEPRFGSCFSVLIQIVAVAETGETSRLAVSTELRWTQSTFMKGVIESSANSGTTSEYKLYCSIIKSATKKRSKGSGAAAEAGEEGDADEGAEGGSETSGLVPANRRRLHLLVKALMPYLGSLVVMMALVILGVFLDDRFRLLERVRGGGTTT